MNDSQLTLVPIVFALLFTAGCATSSSVEPTRSVVDLPAAGESAKRELGDTLLERAAVYSRPGLELAEPFEIPGGLGVHFTVSAGTLVAYSKNENETLFVAPDLKMRTAFSNAPTPALGGIAVSADGRNARLWLGFRVNGKTRFEIPSIVNVARVSVVAVGRPYFRQELIYNGCSGTTLTFTYRELTNDVIRGPFTQELQYDMGAGNTIGFKGARLLVEHATNTEIRYKVLSNFRPN